MKYRTPAAFRQALEERLRQRSLGQHIALTRLRKMVAFDRLLARLARSDPQAWVLKGGLALQVRLPDRARTTKDIDIAVMEDWKPEKVSMRLRKAASLNLRDWFEFEVAAPGEAATGAARGGFRYPVRCLVDGRSFETFHVDVGQGDPISEAPEKITLPNLLGFAGLRPAVVRCYPLAAQVAEKLHAYTRAYAGGATSRVRDLADMLLAASMTTFTSSKLMRAIQSTFQVRGTHAVPDQVPKPPTPLATPYAKLARDLNLPWPTLQEAGNAVAEFLNPVLRGSTASRWHAAAWKWRRNRI